VIRDGSTATHLYRIAQEAVTNCGPPWEGAPDRYQPRQSHGRIALAIEDDGVGLPNRGSRVPAWDADYGARAMILAGSFRLNRTRPEHACHVFAARVHSSFRARTGFRGMSASPFGKRKVFLVDDHPLVREWLTNLINQQSDLVVCARRKARRMHCKPSPNRNLTSRSSTFRLKTLRALNW